jgi:hypothetical protein
MNTTTRVPNPAIKARQWFLALALAIVGLVPPWIHNLRCFAGGGSVAPEVFRRAAIVNALTAAITLDVVLSARAGGAKTCNMTGLRPRLGL